MRSSRKSAGCWRVTNPTALDRLRGQAFDGVLSASGRGTPPQDVPPDQAKRAAAATPEEFVQIYPVGWEGVTAAGRVEAESRARVRAYDAMGAAVRAIRLGPAGTLGAMVKDSAGAETLLDTFVRGLPLAGPVRLMPDRIAEADLAAPIRDLIKVLRDIRAMTPQDPRWAETRIDELSVALKTDRVLVTGRGMPPPEGLRPADALAEPPSAPLPDWAAAVLEAKARARLPEDIENPDQARLLAARAAKAKALEDLEPPVGRRQTRRRAHRPRAGLQGRCVPQGYLDVPRERPDRRKPPRPR